MVFKCVRANDLQNLVVVFADADMMRVSSVNICPNRLTADKFNTSMAGMCQIGYLEGSMLNTDGAQIAINRELVEFLESLIG